MANDDTIRRRVSVARQRWRLSNVDFEQFDQVMRSNTDLKLLERSNTGAAASGHEAG